VRSAVQMYRDWQGHIAAALKNRFFNVAAGSLGSQGANTLALAFNVLPEEDARILTALVEDIRARGNHMNVGVMGVRFILEVLTRRGEGDLALALMHQDTYPGFGHLIQRGATTLWECWGEVEHDRKHGARSLNHPFMGGYDNWYFNTLAGIRPDPANPGFKHIILEPHPIKGVAWVRCWHDGHQGRIESNWRIERCGFKWNVVVPEGVSATATLPFGGGSVALAFNVLPDEDARILATLVGDIRARGNHMNVGVMGVRFILEVLTQRGEGELALSLMHQDSYPSFGHLIQRGATTLWECWGEKEHDRKHGARSLNHPFMGGYDNWFFNTLAGIRPDPANPGFSHFFLDPHPVKGLQWMDCHHDCRRGRIESNWRIEKDDFIWEIVITAGTTATATLPCGGAPVALAAGQHKLSLKL